MLKRQEIMKSIMLSPVSQYFGRKPVSESKSNSIEYLQLDNETAKIQTSWQQQNKQRDHSKLKIYQNEQLCVKIIPDRKNTKSLQIMTIRTPGSIKSSDQSFFVFQNSLADVKDMLDSSSLSSELSKTKKKALTAKNSDIQNTVKPYNFDTIAQQNTKSFLLRKRSGVSDFTFNDKNSNQSSQVKTQSYQIPTNDRKLQNYEKVDRICQTIKPVKRIHQLRKSKVEMSLKTHIQQSKILIGEFNFQSSKIFSQPAKKRLLKCFLEQYRQKSRSPSLSKKKLPKNIERGLFYN